MKSIVYLALALMLLLAACKSKQEGNGFQHKLARLDLQEDLSVSIDSLNVVIGGTIQGMAVDSHGNIYLENRKEVRIDILSSAGRYLDSLGHRGHGPGEFQSISGVHIYNNILYALDTYLNRLSEFRLDNLQLLRTTKFPDIQLGDQPIGTPSEIYPLVNDRYEVVFKNGLLTMPDPKLTLSIIAHNLEPVDTIVRQFPPTHAFYYRDPRNLAVFSSLSRRTFATFGPHGYVYETNADSMHIRVFDVKGKKIQDISASYSPPRLTQSDLDSIASEMSPLKRNMFYKAVNQNTLSDHWPALQDLLVDDQGRCWVELVTPGKKKHTWWVFDTDGKLKWEFKLSKHLTLYLIHNNKAYGVWSKKGAYSRIVRYHVEGI